MRINRTTRKRRGMLTAELLLALPILLILLFATLQFVMLLMADQAISAAASIAAREAALPSATTARVEFVVGEVLDSWRFYDGLGPVEIRVNGMLASPDMAATGDIVSVKLSAPSNSAAPDLLRFFGETFSIADKQLCHEAVARKE
ncbi:MAG: pilus assembly protein [Pirellulales bacterium]|nr:pilus assembly protein [Pirellulales bacterium]